MSDQKSKPAQSDPAQRDLGTLGFLIEEHKDEKRRLRAGLLVAAATHMVVFAINWPTIASPPPEPPEAQPIRVVELYRYTPPERREVEMPQVPEATIINIPDPTPDDPEPLREPPAELPEIDWGDTVTGAFVAPDPPPDNTPTLIQVGLEVKPPKRIHMVDPKYTNVALAAHKEGTVILELIIDEQGDVADVKVLRGLPLGLTESAVEAAWQWRFEPSTLDGRPVSVIYQLSVTFKLSRG